MASDVGPRLDVVAPDAEHLAWSAAQELARRAGPRGVVLTATLADPERVSAAPDLVVMPVRSLAARVPALQILEVPFLFPDRGAVHAALDGPLGEALRARARRAGFEILAFWDEGMHAMSGNRRFDRRINLTGVEFLLLRPDPIAEQAFHALNAWTRPARPQSRDALLRECLVGSRAATLQQIRREELFRVHLDLSVTAQRYEGWVLVAPAARWRGLTEEVRETIASSALDMRGWQRREAERRESESLAALGAEGMQVHRLDETERQAFRERMPPAERMLPAALGPALRTQLVRLATGGAALGAPRTEQGPDPDPRPAGGKP
jgi:C4-dicarboxylate-binding protein DctP